MFDIFKEAYIRQLSNGKYRVYSEKGKNMGTYYTKDKAKNILKKIEFFKQENYTDDISIEPIKTYSGVMRKLRNGDKDRLKKFMIEFKNVFDDAIDNDLDFPDQIALLAALKEINWDASETENV